MFPNKFGVLVQLDVRRQRYTKRNQFKENLIHGAGLIGFVDKNFTKLISIQEQRKAYTLDLTVKALKNYISKNFKSKIVLEQFFDLLCFDALIGGTDRHYNNWGILERADDSEFIRLAPAFDNGVSLLWKMDEYRPKFLKDLCTQRFIRRPESMFKKIGGGKYDLFEVLEALYSIPEFRGSGIAKKIFNRLCSVKVGFLKMTMLKNIPQDPRFRSGKDELLYVYQYAIIRLELLKNQLLKIDRLYK
jgi:hypothetical protein